MAAMRAVFDFHAHKVIIDGIRLPMQPRELQDRSVHYQTFVEISEEPSATKELAQQAIDILDANYETANLPAEFQRDQLLQLLLELIPRRFGVWQTDPVSITFKPGAESYCCKQANPVPRVHRATLRKEIDRLESIGVLKRQDDSEWPLPTLFQSLQKKFE